MTLDLTPHAADVESLLDALGVDPDRGLAGDEVERRRERHGPNRLRTRDRRSLWSILADQLKSVVLILMGAASAIAFALAHWTEAVAILAVLVVNAAIGVASELRAVRSMEALQQLDRLRTRVRRDGGESEVWAENLVPGDVVLLGAGAKVPADLRITSADGLRVEEAALTGESVAVAKSVDPVDGDIGLSERTSMLHKGTTVVEGAATGVVTATGMDTELGRISELAQEAETRSSPLQQRLDRLGRRLAWITLATAAVVAGAGLLAGQPTVLMLETAIALGVAAIPEGLPVVATIALARGMWLMARRHAVINRLPAVETLGTTRIIMTDKTGTLTENRMTLRRVVTGADDHDLEEVEDPADEPLLEHILRVGVLCNNARLAEGEMDEVGDPTEVALLEAGRRLAGIDREELLEELPETREVSFDPEVMMMATFHRTDDGFLVAVKGAPDRVLEAASSIADGDDDGRPLDDGERERWLQRNDELAGEGFRVMAVADRRMGSDDEEPYRKLRFLGLICLIDPAREGVREAVEDCRRAGMRTVMLTGDQPRTAAAVARQVGLVDADEAEPEVLLGADLRPPGELSEEERERIDRTSIFARVSPEQKLDLVGLYQERGEAVAMTGDGVNDAPALKKADIGVAMGRRGTDAARQVADMVLEDDALASIVAAVRQGRVIFHNIRMSVMFMLCTNVAEVVAVAAASLAGAPLPLKPLQILYLNVLTDVFPALALGVGPGPPGVMDSPPRSPGESVLTSRHWRAVGGWAVLIGACVLGALALALEWLGLDQTRAVTVSFLTLAFAKLWFVFNLRAKGTALLDNEVVRNPWVWGALALCAGLLAAAVYLPVLSGVLSTAAPGWSGWGVVLALSLVPLAVGQVLHLHSARRARGMEKGRRNAGPGVKREK